MGMRSFTLTSLDFSIKVDAGAQWGRSPKLKEEFKVTIRTVVANET